MSARLQSYETETMDTVRPYPCDQRHDREYIQQYSSGIALTMLDALRQRWAGRPQPRATDTDKVSIPSPTEASKALLEAAEHYYRTSLRPVPPEFAVALQALRRVLHDPAQCITALNDVLLCFVHSLAVVESGELRRAVQAAQLSLKTLQSTWAELPAVNEGSWLLTSNHGIVERGE